MFFLIADLENAKFLTAKYAIEPEPRNIVVFRYVGEVLRVFRMFPNVMFYDIDFWFLFGVIKFINFFPFLFICLCLVFEIKSRPKVVDVTSNHAYFYYGLVC